MLYSINIQWYNFKVTNTCTNFLKQNLIRFLSRKSALNIPSSFNCDSQYYGYDKLSPYGIGISECIDRFSRYMLWLEAYQTNRDPKLIAGYFTDTVKKIGKSQLHNSKFKIYSNTLTHIPLFVTTHSPGLVQKIIQK
jgi:hypothetical protein